MRALRPIGRDDQLSIIDHLDELRSRLMACAVVLFVVFCGCFVFNHALIGALNRALPPAAKTGLGSQQTVNTDFSRYFRGEHKRLAAAGAILKAEGGRNAAVGSLLLQQGRQAGALAKRLPVESAAQQKPLTLGVGESFTTTLVVVGYFALLFTLPMLLYELYAFVVPALSRDERKLALPATVAAPALFILGAGFTYFEVLPPAIHFLQGYNSSQFQTLLQAKAYYKFEVLMMIGVGLCFEVPLVLLGLQKLGVISSRTLTLNWRYAAVIIAVLAAALPGVDPVTMTLETVPLILLYVASIGMMKWVEHRNYKRALAQARSGGNVAGDSSVG